MQTCLGHFEIALGFGTEKSNQTKNNKNKNPTHTQKREKKPTKQGVVVNLQYEESVYKTKYMFL